jgi:hypothetical protein
MIGGEQTGPRGADGTNLEIDPLDLVDPARYARRGYPHDV